MDKEKMMDIEEIMDEEEPIKAIFIFTKEYELLRQYLSTLVRSKAYDVLEGKPIPKFYLNLVLQDSKAIVDIYQITDDRDVPMLQSILEDRMKNIYHLEANKILYDAFLPVPVEDLQCIAGTILEHLESILIPSAAKVFHCCPLGAYIYTQEFLTKNNVKNILIELDEKFGKNSTGILFTVEPARATMSDSSTKFG